MILVRSLRFTAVGILTLSAAFANVIGLPAGKLTDVPLQYQQGQSVVNNTQTFDHTYRVLVSGSALGPGQAFLNFFNSTVWASPDHAAGSFQGGFLTTESFGELKIGSAVDLTSYGSDASMVTCTHQCVVPFEYNVPLTLRIYAFSRIGYDARGIPDVANGTLLGSGYVELSKPLITSNAGWLDMAPNVAAVDITGDLGASVQAVPEPATVVTMAAALVLLAGIRSWLRAVMC